MVRLQAISTPPAVPGFRAQALAALWPAAGKGPSVWAVLDGARDPRIYLALLESRLEFRCLYSGRLPRELEMVAPQLVELLPGHRLTERLLGEGAGQAWGVFMQAADASNLRHHLRKFLKVEDEAGRRLIFRYYDPRVLRAYLPTCRHEELRQVFGPVAAFLAENAEGTGLDTFRLAGKGLEHTRAPRAGAEEGAACPS